MDSQKIVRDFCEAFSRRDVKELLGFLSPDCVYHNIPLEPLKGRAAIELVLTGFLGGCSEVEFAVRAVASAGDTVMTERVDRFLREDGTRIELPVMGAFEVGPDGKIVAWRDYFDLATWTRQSKPA